MTHDVIVIGAGIGGLASAALLAAQNKRVLLLEATDRIGGFQHRFERDGFCFEPNFHFLQDAGPGRPVRQLLDGLGIEQQFHRLDPVARFSFPDRTVDVCNDRAEFIARLKADFPDAAQGIDAVFAAMHDIYIALTTQQPSPLLAQHGAETVEEFLHRFISNTKLKAIVGAWAAYFGYGTAHISALAIAVFTEACWDGGVYHPHGGIASIERKLQAVIERHGGEVRLNARVEQIFSDAGRASGVRLTDGTTYQSQVVISTIDTITTARDLIADKTLAAPLVKQIEALERFRSPFCVYLGVRSEALDLHQGPAVRVDFHSDDIEAQDRAQLAGDIEHATLSLGIPTRYNTELAPAGHDIVILYTFIPNAMIDSLLNDTARAQAFAERIVIRADRVIPGLKNNVVVMETSASATPMLYTQNSKGAIGWAPTPQMLPQMPDHKSPIPGLYLAGQWTRTGAGMNNVFASAHIVTAMIFLELVEKR
jgi:phytoene dehydrogenase-like protein